MKGSLTFPPDISHLLWCIFITTTLFHPVSPVWLVLWLCVHVFTLVPTVTSPASEQMSNDIMWKNVFILTVSLRYKMGRCWKTMIHFWQSLKFSPASCFWVKLRKTPPRHFSVLYVHRRYRYWSSHLSLGETATKHFSQNVKEMVQCGMTWNWIGSENLNWVPSHQK